MARSFFTAAAGGVARNRDCDGIQDCDGIAGPRLDKILRSCPSQSRSVDIAPAMRRVCHRTCRCIRCLRVARSSWAACQARSGPPARAPGPSLRKMGHYQCRSLLAVLVAMLSQLVTGVLLYFGYANSHMVRAHWIGLWLHPQLCTPTSLFAMEARRRGAIAARVSAVAAPLRRRRNWNWLTYWRCSTSRRARRWRRSSNKPLRKHLPSDPTSLNGSQRAEARKFSSARPQWRPS